MLQNSKSLVVTQLIQNERSLVGMICVLQCSLHFPGIGPPECNLSSWNTCSRVQEEEWGEICNNGQAKSLASFSCRVWNHQFKHTGYGARLAVVELMIYKAGSAMIKQCTRVQNQQLKYECLGPGLTSGKTQASECKISIGHTHALGHMLTSCAMPPQCKDSEVQVCCSTRIDTAGMHDSVCRCVVKAFLIYSIVSLVSETLALEGTHSHDGRCASE